ncbi:MULTISPECIES: M4 family metallopeptidase [Streptomyces]|uniref:Neutral metalloproteinase n=1 Tax=Streptomyces sviceus (strain ATCC 29083 / DSM 924 / JCM 4929 / NBRC 13980 / NCIMB 11184 / NRRL 5439 / UC 5370) TaxID=463191 RepID=B5HMH0_STRX2|nr:MULTISPECIES: M4 family metallopeptidase [Streptomyces]EDY54025.1 neutral zinc metalloprotease [Streptomyces sviceus ATCC 29083]MYT08517.1 peptidase M4 family protein [Streptomyces sp. SID5470]
MTPLYARHKRTTLAIATAVAAGALLTTGLTTGSAAAVAEGTGKATLAGAPAQLSAAARTSLIKEQQADAGTTAREIGLGAKEKLVVKDVVRDADGTVHTRYERTYDGLPVLGGDLVVHESKSGATEGVSKATNKTIKVASLTPKLTVAKAEAQALTAAKAAGSDKTAADGARKVIWAGSGTPVLAYETIVGGFQDDGTPNQLHVITDAATGKKLYEYQGIENATGTGKSLYSGTVSLETTLSGSTYQLTDGTRGSLKTYNKSHGTSSSAGTLFTDADNTWGTGAASSSTTDQTAAVDAAYGAAETWDFYKSTFGRSGIKNNGVGAYSRVHYGNQYVNAFWDDSCFCMTYGDGEGNVSPLTSLDVAGHEMSHGVTANTAGLNYSGESGGLNEATSDIFGTGVEFYANNSKDVGDYLIGEKIDINGDGTPLRYMDKPSKDGGSADSWSSSVGNLDVHYSSGVANHFFYLLSEGSGAKTINGVSYNSPTSNGSTVTGIGRAKALQIWYKALTTYFTSTTNYKSARTGTLSAASALYGSTSAEYKAVAAAWSAVNVS